VETWGLGGVNNETKIAGLIIDFASVRAGLMQKSIISPAWTDNRFFRRTWSLRMSAGTTESQTAKTTLTGSLGHTVRKYSRNSYDNVEEVTHKQCFIHTVNVKKIPSPFQS